MEELKPCPFCDGNAEIEQSGTIWHIYCTNDGSHGHYINNYLSMEESVASWNDRYERTKEAHDANM